MGRGFAGLQKGDGPKMVTEIAIGEACPVCYNNALSQRNGGLCMKVMKRNGSEVDFQREKITIAIGKAAKGRIEYIEEITS